MQFLDLTLQNPEENLALDEALLDLAEAGESGETLRFWESPTYFVVLGYSNKVNTEVGVPQCQEDNIPILRRSSGGGTVLQGPGCLNYNLVLDLNERPDLRSIKESNCSVMQQIAKSLKEALPDVKYQGLSDLTVNEKKFSGNAQRRKKRFMIFHGTFLYNMDLSLIERYLNQPSDEPSYRKQRSHKDFVTNIALNPSEIKFRIKKAWKATEERTDYPTALLDQLIKDKYSQDFWNKKY